MLAAMFTLAWTSCDDDIEYTPAGAVQGAGVYFTPSTVTEYELEGPEGSITLNVMRTDSVGAINAELKATYTEGGENVFTVPGSVSFAEGSSTSSVTIDYNNVVRGTTYEIELSFAEGTPYGRSSVTLSLLYPEEKVEVWEVVSEEAVLVENLFEAFGSSPMNITGITVEKEQTTNMYRFRSPFNNEYFMEQWGVEIYADDSNLPYIILDGETYGDAGYYIAPTALNFQMVNGEGPKEDATWNTFGSVAGNLSTADGPIKPGNATYPLGTYTETSKMFDLGSVYHNIGGYGYYTFGNGVFLLYLDPSMMGTDYDRDYTWSDLPEATGFFTSELHGESWMQAVQIAEEDSTFYRMPNLYSDAEKAHIYFHVNFEDGTVDIPDTQNTGMTTFGNPVYLEGVSTLSSYDETTGTLNLGFRFYIGDEEGEKVADLATVTETFLWGQSEFDQLQSSKIDDYVGNWIIPFSDGSETLQIPATISKVDETTLAVKGLSGAADYDDTMLLSYDTQTGWIRFSTQEVASLQGFQVFVFPYNSETGEFNEESLIGGITKSGTLKFLNDESNEGKYDAMVYVVNTGNGYSYLTGYWNFLEWGSNTAAAATKSVTSFGLNMRSIKHGFTPRRVYNNNLDMQPQPIQSHLSRNASMNGNANLFM